MAFGRKKDTDSLREGLIDSYRFRLTAGNDVARKFWTDMEIPYMAISAVEIADRTVTTFEGLAGGLNSRQLNQKNNIHVSFLGADGPTVLRFEMLTGVTVHPRRDTAPSKTRDRRRQTSWRS